MKKILSTLAIILLLPLSSYASNKFEIHIQKGHLFFGLKCDNCQIDENGERKPLRTYLGMYEGEFDIEPLLEKASYFDLSLHYYTEFINDFAYYLRDNRTYFAQYTPEQIRSFIIDSLYATKEIPQSILNFNFFNSEDGDMALGSDLRSEDTDRSLQVISFPITDEQADKLYAHILESLEKEQNGELQLHYKSHNCIHFTQEAYNAAGLNNTEGDFFDHVMSGNGPWAQDATIVDLLDAGQKGELSFAAALYHYLFR